MFLVSMADIIGSYERLPNDAVRAVAVAKRREYLKSNYLIAQRAPRKDKGQVKMKEGWKSRGSKRCETKDKNLSGLKSG